MKCFNQILPPAKRMPPLHLFFYYCFPSNVFKLWDITKRDLFQFAYLLCQESRSAVCVCSRHGYGDTLWEHTYIHLHLNTHIHTQLRQVTITALAFFNKWADVRGLEAQFCPNLRLERLLKFSRKIRLGSSLVSSSLLYPPKDGVRVKIQHCSREPALYLWRKHVILAVTQSYWKSCSAAWKKKKIVPTDTSIHHKWSRLVGKAK